MAGETKGGPDHNTVESGSPYKRVEGCVPGFSTPLRTHLSRSCPNKATKRLGFRWVADDSQVREEF